MENAVEALKIAGAVLLFVLALSLSISCLSQANSSVSTITTMYDKEAQYNYVKPASDLTRKVGAETIIPTMYKAYEENIKIIFKDKNGNSLPIYYKTNQYGNRVNAEGDKVSNSSPDAVTVDCIDLSEEGFGAQPQSATNHLSMILAGRERWKRQNADNQEMLELLEDTKYGNQFMLDSYPDGLYQFLVKNKFTESLGEYYQGNDSTKIKKRIIIYQLIN